MAASSQAAFRQRQDDVLTILFFRLGTCGLSPYSTDAERIIHLCISPLTKSKTHPAGMHFCTDGQSNRMAASTRPHRLHEDFANSSLRPAVKAPAGRCSTVRCRPGNTTALAEPSTFSIFRMEEQDILQPFPGILVRSGILAFKITVVGLDFDPRFTHQIVVNSFGYSGLPPGRKLLKPDNQTISHFSVVIISS